MGDLQELTTKLDDLEKNEQILHNTIALYISRVLRQGRYVTRQRTKDEEKVQNEVAEVEKALEMVNGMILEFTDLLSDEKEAKQLKFIILQNQLTNISARQREIILDLFQVASRLNEIIPKLNNWSTKFPDEVEFFKIKLQSWSLQKKAESVNLDLANLNEFSENIDVTCTGESLVGALNTLGWSTLTTAQLAKTDGALVSENIDKTNKGESLVDALNALGWNTYSTVELAELDEASGNQDQKYEENSQLSKGCATWYIEELVSWVSSDVSGSEERFGPCNCSDHAYFIPIQHLTMDHMPGKYKDLKLDLVHAVAAVTLRGEFPPMYIDYRPNSRIRCETGFITSVKKRKGTCPCCCCKITPPERYRDWFEVTVETENWPGRGHDDVTDYVWRYDLGRSGAVFFHGLEFKNQEKCSDDHNGASSLHCEVVCVTHDQEVGLKIIEAKGHERTLRKKFQRTLTQDKFVFFVSYPPGQSQQVTIGKLMEKEGPVSEIERCDFANGLCPGCLGAPVFIPDMTDGISSPRVFYYLRGIRKLSFTPRICIETFQANS